MTADRFSWLKKDNREQLEWIARYIQKRDPQAAGASKEKGTQYRQVKKLLDEFVRDKPSDNTRENGYKRYMRITGAWQQHQLRQNIRSGKHDKVIYQTHLPQEAMQTLKKLAEQRGQRINTTLADIIMAADKPVESGTNTSTRMKTEQQMNLGF